MTEPVVTIKFTQSEVKKLVESLRVIKDIKLLPLLDWKKPYVQLLKDLEKIDNDIDDAKRCGDTLVKMTELPKHLKKLYEEIEDVNS